MIIVVSLSTISSDFVFGLLIWILLVDAVVRLLGLAPHNTIGEELHNTETTAAEESSSNSKNMPPSCTKKRCNFCGKKGGESSKKSSSSSSQLMTCGACETTAYCSRKCQKGDWEEHQYECTGLKGRELKDTPFEGIRPSCSSKKEWDEHMKTMKSCYPEGTYWITMNNGNPSTDWEHFSKRDFSKHVIFFITKRRDKVKNKFTKALVGQEEYKNRGTKWFGAELAYDVVRVWREVFLPKYEHITNPKYKFDFLFGYTSAIYENWFWMQRHPYEWDGHYMLQQLGDYWKELFEEHGSKPKEELGLDEEYSYKGALTFLAKFKKDLEEERCGCSNGPLKFIYK